MNTCDEETSILSKYEWIEREVLGVIFVTFNTYLDTFLTFFVKLLKLEQDPIKEKRELIFCISRGGLYKLKVEEKRPHFFKMGVCFRQQCLKITKIVYCFVLKGLKLVNEWRFWNWGMVSFRHLVFNYIGRMLFGFQISI